MFKNFLESITLKDIIFIGIILILFLKMNKLKEKFVWTAPDDDDGFKTKVENALGNNLTAIKNLGNLSKKILDTSDGDTLNLSETNLKVNGLEIINSGNLTVDGFTVNKNFLEKLNKIKSKFYFHSGVKRITHDKYIKNDDLAGKICANHGGVLATKQDVINDGPHGCGCGARAVGATGWVPKCNTQKPCSDAGCGTIHQWTNTGWLPNDSSKYICNHKSAFCKFDDDITINKNAVKLLTKDIGT